MNNRIVTNILLATLLSVNLFSFAEKSVSQKTVEKSNIIFILTDDQRFDALGYAGNSIIQTPHMDKLAQSGAYFSHAFVTTPICSASRASIFCGVHERAHRYTFQTGPIREKFMEKSYPKLLKDNGYYTGFFGKFGVNFEDKDKLFDVIEDYDRNGRFKDYRGYYYKTLNGDTVHLTRYTGQKALDFIENAPPGKPFCLSLSFSAPHAHDAASEQYFWQESQNFLFADMEMPAPKLAGDEWFYKLPGPVREGFNRKRWFWRFDTPEKYQHSIKGYYRMIKGIDDEIAGIREKLKEKGLDDNTVIIMMGDNGYFLGERQLAGKWLMYDNSVRVPLIVYDPRVKKHRDISEMALNIDIPATIADLAGIEIPAGWHGKSLIPLVHGKQKSLNRDTILIEHLWEFENIPPSEGIRTNEWKYFRYVNDKSAEELYNFKDDPMETKNLADDPEFAGVLKELSLKTDELAAKFSGNLSGKPYGLHVETIRDPRYVKIIDRHSELGWIVPQSAVFQKAYQVLVASSQDLIYNNIGDVWNSGQVWSNNSYNIQIKNELQPNSTYFWKVRIFDKDNRVTDYSDAQKFETGNFNNGMLTSSNYFIVEEIKPAEIQKKTDGSYFVDFGKAAFAALDIHYKPGKEENLTIRLGEKTKDGKIDRNPEGTIRYQEVNLQVFPEKEHYQIELVPDKRNTLPVAVSLPDTFPVIFPFRYVEIEGFDENFNPENLVQKAFFYYFDYEISSFSSSDTILNRVWDFCKYSMKATSFTGFYIDGDRERIPYEADAYINQLSHYGVDNEYTIARKTIEYFMQKPTWPTEWQLHVALMFYQDYMYTGNTQLIKEYYEPLTHKTLMALEVEDGFISTSSPNHNGELMKKLGFQDTTQRLRDIVDWPQKGGFGGVMGEDDGFVFRPVNTVVNSMYYGNLKILVEFARLLGKSEEALNFEQKAARVKKSINQKIYNKEKGRYTDGLGTGHASVHSNMFPLAFGLVPEEYKKPVAEFIKTRGMACSVYGAQYLMEALYNAGAEDYALELMTATHDRSWYNMIKSGSTITMEAWDMKYKPNSDWNHAWGGVPGNIIPRKLWGVEPAKPGFDEVSIHPMLSTLSKSEITVPTIKGQIKCSYKKLNATNLQYSIELPANMVGEFKVDFSPDDIVILNNKPANLLFGSIRLKPGVNEIKIRTNSF